MTSKLSDHRALAVMFGGKALTGTAKQKNWAEAIRADFLASDDLSIDDKIELCTSRRFQSSRFWIDNRKLAPALLTTDNIINVIRTINDLEQQIVIVQTTTRSSAKLNQLRAELDKAKVIKL